MTRCESGENLRVVRSSRALGVRESARPASVHPAQMPKAPWGFTVSTGSVASAAPVAPCGHGRVFADWAKLASPGWTPRQLRASQGSRWRSTVRAAIALARVDFEKRIGFCWIADTARVPDASIASAAGPSRSQVRSVVLAPRR
jgi:hypothetical protein